MASLFEGLQPSSFSPYADVLVRVLCKDCLKAQLDEIINKGIEVVLDESDIRLYPEDAIIGSEITQAMAAIAVSSKFIREHQIGTSHRDFVANIHSI